MLHAATLREVDFAVAQLLLGVSRKHPGFRTVVRSVGVARDVFISEVRGSPTALRRGFRKRKVEGRSSFPSATIYYDATRVRQRGILVC